MNLIHKLVSLQKWGDLVHGARASAQMLFQAGKGVTFGVIITTIIHAAAPLAIAIVSGVAIVHVATDFHNLPLHIVFLIPGCFFVYEANQIAIRLMGEKAKQRVDSKLRSQVLNASLGPPSVAHLEDINTREAYNAAREISPFSFTPGDAVQYLPFAVAVRLEGLMAAGVLAIYAPEVTAVLFILYILSQVSAVGVTFRMVAASAFTMHDPAITYLRDLVLTPPAAKEMRIFGLGSWFQDRYMKLTSKKADRALEAQHGLFRGYGISGAILGLGLCSGILWIGLKAMDGQLDDVSFAVSVLVIIRWFSVTNMIPDIPVMYGVVAIPAVERVMAHSQSIVSTSKRIHPTPQLTSHIQFQDLSFQYPGTDDLVLDRLNLTIPVGQNIAIVGLNGAGKTTLIKLLCRLYDPVTGTIIVDGIDLAHVDPLEWRKHIGVLFQDFIQWPLSVQDNISLRSSKDEFGYDRQTTKSAVELSGATEVIDSLSNNINTILSQDFANGTGLSGGEWQKIGLARLLFRLLQGSKLLILDEPTANLDPVSERNFYQSVLNNPLLNSENNNRPKVTTILISHRFRTVRHADRIVVLEEGHITEDGTHNQLLQLGGQYAELFNAQASLYRKEYR